jgi:hypothetical protein
MEEALMHITKWKNKSKSILRASGKGKAMEVLKSTSDCRDWRMEG